MTEKNLALESPPSPLPTRDYRKTFRGGHRCGACGAFLYTARLESTGAILHVEPLDVEQGDLQPLLDLPGIADGEPTHVTRLRTRRTRFREHDCPKLKSFTGRRPERKVRP